MTFVPGTYFHRKLPALIAHKSAIKFPLNISVPGNPQLSGEAIHRPEHVAVPAAFLYNVLGDIKEDYEPIY